MKAVIRSIEDLEAFARKAAIAGVLTGDQLTVTLKKFHRPRTNDQNAKLHAMFGDLAEHTGFSAKDIKDYFKTEFGIYKPVRIKPGDPARMIPKGTSEYNVTEMSQMVERVYQVGAEAGCVFIDPEE